MKTTLALAVALAACAHAQYVTETVEFFTPAPNGNVLYGRVTQPRADLYPGEVFSACVFVPGGLGPGATDRDGIAELGFVEIHFNAEGRVSADPTDVPSEGVEDYNGFAHQDDLKAVIDYTHTLPNVMDDNVGVCTGSYGITMGAGTLGRYSDIPVKYLVDLEGPSESFVTMKNPWLLDEDPSNDKTAQTYALFGHYSIEMDPSPANVAWWSERQAKLSIGRMRCRYLRAQSEWDHAQPPNAQWPEFDYYPVWWQNKHCIDLVNLATLGDSVWTRVNGGAYTNPPNTVFSHDNPPVYPPGAMGQPGPKAPMIVEMAGMPPVPRDTSPPGWLHAGWNLISLPLGPAAAEAHDALDDCAAAGNTITNALFSYSPSAGYSVYPHDFTTMSATGYWLSLSTAAEEVLVGYDPPASPHIPLEPGWNLVGCPSRTPAPWADVEVTDGVTTLPAQSAPAWLDPYAYGYEGGYVRVAASGGDDDALRPWHGYWVHARAPGLELVLP